MNTNKTKRILGRAEVASAAIILSLLTSSPTWGQTTNPPGIAPLTGAGPVSSFPVITDTTGAIVSPTNFWLASGNTQQLQTAVSKALTSTTLPQALNTVTNAQGIIGCEDVSVNLNRLDKFYAACFNNNRAIRIFTTSDQSTFLGSSLIDMFGAYFGRTGGLDAGDGSPGAVEFDLGGAVTTGTDSTVWYAALYTLHNTDTITVRRRDNGGDQSLGGTNFFATKFQVRYLQEGSAGTFKVQTNLNGGTWTDVSGATVNAAGATNGGVLNLTFTPGYYSVRIVGTSGNVRIQGMGLWNDTIGNVVANSLGTIGGLTPTNFTGGFSGSLTNIAWPWLAAMAPDLAIIYDTGDFGSTSYAWQFFATNVWPQASQIWCGEFLDSAQQYNPTIRSNALTYNVAYNDSRFDLGTNAAQLIADGFLQGDGVHLTDPMGCQYMNQKLFRKIIFNAGNFASGYLDPKFKYGTQVGLLNTGNTNHIGIGIAPSSMNTGSGIPQTMFNVFDNASRDFWGDGADASLGFWMFNFNNVPTRLANTNSIFSTDGNFLWFTPPGWRNGSSSAVIGGQPFPNAVEAWRFYGHDTVNGGSFNIGGNTFEGTIAGDQGPGILAVENGLFVYNLSGFKNSDQTTTSTTFANLAMNNNPTLVNGKKYRFSLVLFLTESTAADGVKVDFAGGTATATNFRVHGELVNDTGGVVTLAAAASTTLSGVLNASATTTANQHEFRFDGTIEPSAGGTFIPRIAQNAHSTGTLTATRGSSLILTQYP